VVKVVKGLPEEWGMCSRTVSLDKEPLAFSYWNNTIAVGSKARDIIILDGVTGSQVAALSGHIDWVRSLTFSSDGISLVSGSDDCTVKLWDIQTGGVVKTFSGHTNWVHSVSISADYTKIASGSSDNTIHLWDIQTGGCHHVIKQQGPVLHVNFSPTNPHYLLSKSNEVVWHWDTNGHQILPTYDGFHSAFSPDGTLFVLSNRGVTVQNSDSGAIMAEFHVSGGNAKYCCFSPDGRLVAITIRNTIYVWDITTPDPCLVETFIGHTNNITSLAFSSPSSLISASEDNSIKFWQIGGSSMDPVATDPKPIPSTLASIESVSLQARDGIAISSDSAGVVKTWDILTGLCKTSFQTPATGNCWRDAQLIDGRLILVWLKDKKVHIWDAGKGEHLQTLDAPGSGSLRISISGDGFGVFYQSKKLIQAWSMWTWEPVGEVGSAEDWKPDYLQVDSSRIWVQLQDLSTQGWDFGISGSSPIPLPNPSTERPDLVLVPDPWRIKDTVTGKDIFQLFGEYADAYVAQWDGRYLVVGYESGKVLILDFHYVYPK